MLLTQLKLCFLLWISKENGSHIIVLRKDRSRDQNSENYPAVANLVLVVKYSVVRMLEKRLLRLRSRNPP